MFTMVNWIDGIEITIERVDQHRDLIYIHAEYGVDLELEDQDTQCGGLSQIEVLPTSLVWIVL